MKRIYQIKNRSGNDPHSLGMFRQNEIGILFIPGSIPRDDGMKFGNIPEPKTLVAIPPTYARLDPDQKSWEYLS